MKVEECVVRDEVFATGADTAEWDSIVVPGEIKDRLFRTAVLAMQLRTKVPFTISALHGLALLYGPPGTGKTTLARGLAAKMTAVVPAVRLIEVNPHGLMSAEHGQSQQAVMRLLTEYIPSLADDNKPTVVLLDEVESMAVARSAASLSANPADVHRATDAVLTAMDYLTSNHPHLVTVATSNFTDALDAAFKSRADDTIYVPVPSPDAIRLILAKTLTGLGGVYPALAELAEEARLVEVADALEGLDGRQVRKVVTDAMKLDLATTVAPGKLTIDALVRAAAGRKKAGHAAA